ncbi:hypothetical protein [Carboxylicivirga sp. RSCT41]|uniref:hypothetical protein n=1 Tax=Carboxylicivirga agarovorans TaxID=3417570 RepID=UPI003D34EA35
MTNQQIAESRESQLGFLFANSYPQFIKTISFPKGKCYDMVIQSHTGLITAVEIKVRSFSQHSAYGKRPFLQKEKLESLIKYLEDTSMKDNDDKEHLIGIKYLNFFLVFDVKTYWTN